MPRSARFSPGGYCYHVLNRGNGRAQVFHDSSDYQNFIHLTRIACERISMRVIAYCVMPNHFHLVVWPYGDGDLSRWMQLLLSGHTHGYRNRYQSNGHIWQGRFKSFAIEDDDHLLAVIRYVERNPLRAGLVDFVNDWKWSSFAELSDQSLRRWLHEGPVSRALNWNEVVHQPQTEAELAAVRTSIERDMPYGSPAWTLATCARLGLTSKLRTGPKNR